MSELSEEEVLKECNKLFVTMANVHIDGTPMKCLLDLYQKEKELSLIRFKNLVKIQEEKDKIYNEGYFQGVKDERDNTEEHIKEIIYPTPENPISLEMQCSKMYKKLLELLEERN